MEKKEDKIQLMGRFHIFICTFCFSIAQELQLGTAEKTGEESACLIHLTLLPDRVVLMGKL